MNYLEFNGKLQELDKLALKRTESIFGDIEDTEEYNQTKVLAAFIKNRVSATDFNPSTGYGYDDTGRDKLDRIVADVFGAEDALIRHTFASGTHTLSTALFGVLRPGDTVVSVTGKPYDTICGVFGTDGTPDGSLADFGIKYKEVALLPDGTPDINAIRSEFSWGRHKMAYIQRSRGYSRRPSLTVEDISELISAIKDVSPSTVVMVDNCYGEFTQKTEPTEVGADLMAGSLIKNPGGGIAPCGGYIAGRRDLVEKCSYRMTCAGVGREVGATLGHNKELYMGFFAAPRVTAAALKTAVYSSALFELAGFSVSPRFDEKRGDIIECITLASRERLIDFCKGMQSGAPVDSFVSPEPSPMPGYTDEVIMAAGSFNLGSSIELSADGPLRPPYDVWMQGGLDFYSAKTGVLLALNKMLKSGNQTF